jgi:hypothetical protein
MLRRTYKISYGKSNRTHKKVPVFNRWVLKLVNPGNWGKKYIFFIIYCTSAKVYCQDCKTSKVFGVALSRFPKRII